MWKRWLAVCLCLCLAGWAQAEAYYTYGYICGEDSVVIYEAERSDSRMLGCVFPGTPVTVIAHQGEWYWIHLDHQEQDDMLMGYVKADQVSRTAPDAQLPVVSLLGEEPVRLCSEHQHITRAMLEAGTEVELMGQTDIYWIVRADGQMGTIPVESAEPAQAALSLLNADYLAQVQQDEANRQAMITYAEEAEIRFGADNRKWPLQQRQEYGRLQEACGIFNVWVDEMPRSTELDQETALRMAKDYFRQMWGVDANAEAWQIYTAFGYNRMEPNARLWQFTFQETAYEESQFLMQLTADTGELYRTSSADAFMSARRKHGYTADQALQDALAEWSERLGRDVEEWTIEEQYDFAQTPVAQLAHYYENATVPKDWEVPVDEALSTARLGLMHRYGLDAEELDRLQLRTQAMENLPERFYYFTWSSWNAEMELWECLYVAQIDMGTGEIMTLSGPGEGNG